MSIVCRPWIFLLALSLPVLAQQNPASTADLTHAVDRTTPPVRDPDRHITLDVVVTDKSGKPVSGLQ